MTYSKTTVSLLNILLFAVFLPVLFSCTDDEGDSQDLDGDIDAEFLGDVEDSESIDKIDGDMDLDKPLENEEEILESSPTVFMDYTEDEKTVSYVDLPRYLGKWYEIATYEIPFQKGCTGSTATYAIDEDENISVINECYLESLDGEYKVDTARAEIVNTDTNAELVVYFTETFGADYWIIELDGQDSDNPYEWAVVGSSLPVFLWILSRTPQMDDKRLEMILNRLETRGYDLEDLSYTLQAEE